MQPPHTPTHPEPPGLADAATCAPEQNASQPSRDDTADRLEMTRTQRAGSQAAGSQRTGSQRTGTEKTLHYTPEQMRARVARFAELEALPIQTDSALGIAARDVIYARKLLSVIGLEGNTHTPINRSAPICGAGGITVTLAVCPPGQGPSLHNHAATFETFTVLQGRFEISWNDDGDEHIILDRWDTISIPPGVCRAFRNLGPEEGVLQVIISGGVHDMDDIAFRPSAAEAIAESSPEALERFKAQGFRFDAGV